MRAELLTPICDFAAREYDLFDRGFVSVPHARATTKAKRMVVPRAAALERGSHDHALPLLVVARFSPSKFRSRTVTGRVCNNEMDDFTTIPGEANLYGLRQSDRNLPEGGKRPLSSMSPTIVLHDGDVVAIAGASGGPRIITGTFQCLLNCIEFDMTAGESVAMPRFHHQWLPNALQLEERWFDREESDHWSIVPTLESLGHEMSSRADVGVVQIIHVMRGGIHAASDPRKGGAPAGD